MLHKKILIIKLGALGDFIQALGPMRAIRRFHPHAHITLLTTRPFADMAARSGFFQDIWIDDRPKIFQPMRWLALRARLNQGGFDRVYDLQNNDRTGFYFHLFGSKPEWVGIAKGASHRNQSPLRTAGSAFDGHVQTLALAGIQKIDIDTLSWVEPDHIFDELQKPYVLLVPGSAANHPEKRWPWTGYAALAKMLIDAGQQPVLIGSAGERDILNAIAQETDGCINLCTRTTLFDIPYLARGAAGAIGNDTGPMHMIGPTGIKTLVLFSGKTHPHRHAPRGAGVCWIQIESLADLTPRTVAEKFGLTPPQI